MCVHVCALAIIHSVVETGDKRRPCSAVRRLAPRCTQVGHECGGLWGGEKMKAINTVMREIINSWTK
jgi:hypothetical protein